MCWGGSGGSGERKGGWFSGIVDVLVGGGRGGGYFSVAWLSHIDHVPFLRRRQWGGGVVVCVGEVGGHRGGGSLGDGAVVGVGERGRVVGGERGWLGEGYD